MLIHPSVTDIDEIPLVERLMANPLRRSDLLRIYGIPESSIPYLNVPLRGLPGQPQGDVDILLSVPMRPDLSTAITAKRIKVGAEALRNQRPNKLREFKRAVRQANLLAKIGFHLVYLYVFVVVDSREQNAGRTTYDGLSAALGSQIDRVVSPSGLDEGVGLIHYEFVQPMDDEPLGVGAYGGQIKQMAKPVSQLPELNEWVAQVIRKLTPVIQVTAS
jgi:hypothetical protein